MNICASHYPGFPFLTSSNRPGDRRQRRFAVIDFWYCDSFLTLLSVVSAERTKPFIRSVETPPLKFCRDFRQLLDNNKCCQKPRKSGKNFKTGRLSVVRSDTPCRGVTSDILASDSLNSISPNEGETMWLHTGRQTVRCTVVSIRSSSSWSGQ